MGVRWCSQGGARQDRCAFSIAGTKVPAVDVSKMAQELVKHSRGRWQLVAHTDHTDTVRQTDIFYMVMDRPDLTGPGDCEGNHLFG